METKVTFALSQSMGDRSGNRCSRIEKFNLPDLTNEYPPYEIHVMALCLTVQVPPIFSIRK